MRSKREAQFTVAFNEHADALFRYCHFKIADRETAKDVLQQTFMKTWLYMSEGNEVTNIKSFLYKTAGNLIIDYYRKKKPLSLDMLMEEGFDRGFDESKTLQNKLDGSTALKLLRKVPDGYREILFMRYVQELSLKEIAEITGETENNIAVKIHRGLIKVKELFYKAENEKND